MKPYVGGLSPGFTHLRREIEPRWVAEYVSETYGQYRASFRVPLGAIPQQLIDVYGKRKATRVYRPSRPEADAIVFTPSQVTLIEAKIFKVREGLGALRMYRDLLPDTPEEEEYSSLPIRAELLCVQPLPWILQAAEKAQIEIVRYAPEWILEIWEERDKYWTKEHVQKREERKEILRKHGYV